MKGQWAMRTVAGLATRPLVLVEPCRLRASAGFLAAPATTGARRAIFGPHDGGRLLRSSTAAAVTRDRHMRSLRPGIRPPQELTESRRECSDHARMG
jgi:hypothetical protein